MKTTNWIEAERERIVAMYQCKDKEGPGKQPWQAAAFFKDAEKKLHAALMLHKAGVFPKPDDPCLEVGFGTLGWLGDLITWGVEETNLHGIELNANRVALAQKVLPVADLRVGDATELPWESNTFALVIVSTVFSSILDERVRRIVAAEVTRVLKPGGALLWYDTAFSPRTPKLKRIGIKRWEIQQLFPQLSGRTRSVTLFPPLARFLVHFSWALATCLAALPFLRTHLLAVLVKKSLGY